MLWMRARPIRDKFREHAVAESLWPLFEEEWHLTWNIRENLTSATSIFYCLGIKISVHG